MDLKKIERQLNVLLSDARQARKRLNRARRDYGDAKHNLVVAKQAQEIIQNVAQLVQQRAHRTLVSIVTKCLQAVFGDDHRFEIFFERKRGKTEARLALFEGKLELNPMAECSGGVVDVAAYGLRLACLMLQPGLRKILILDEPFRYVSQRAGYRERVRDLVLAVSEEMGVQHILITHSRKLEIGKVIEI